MHVLTHREKQVLDVLAGWDADYVVFYSQIAKETGLTVTKARDATKSLRAKGLVEFVKPCYRDEESTTVAGSGNRLTNAGRRAAKELE